MESFKVWFLTGLEHILDAAGYDHILFVTLLTLSARPGEWKRLLVLVTAFTVGHCLTLALSVAADMAFPAELIEFLIAVSILVAALFNLFTASSSIVRPAALYIITLLFGLLHGMGFSFLLRSLLGSEEHMILPLVYFNLGIEAGQLIIVATVTLISLFLTSIIHLPYRYFKFVVVCVITIVALWICSERLLFWFS